MPLPLTKLCLFYVVQGFMNMLSLVCKVSIGRVLQPKALPSSPAAPPTTTHAYYLLFKFSTSQPTCSRPSCTCSIAKASPVRRLRLPATSPRQLASSCAHLLACSTPARLFSSSPASPARLLPRLHSPPAPVLPRNCSSMYVTLKSLHPGRRKKKKEE